MRLQTAPHRCRGRLKRRSWKQRLPIWSVSLILKSTIVNKSLRVRKEPKEDGEKLKDGNGKEVKVHHGNEGVVQRDPKWHNKYFEIEIDEMDPDKLRVKHVWYYVRWRSGIEGWSAGIIYGEKYIDTIEEAKQKNAIVEALFNCKNNPVYITHDQTKHDYNDYKCNANLELNGERVYRGKGHAGWDVVTKGGAAVPFYSLTTGKLVAPVDGRPDPNNTIAVYDKETQMTILYLHARDILVKPDEEGMVRVGQLLGTQGDTSHREIGVHVHIEVQEGEIHEGEVIRAAPWANEKTTNPITYLYKNQDLYKNWAVHTREQGGGSPNEYEQFDVNRDGHVNVLDLLEVLRNVGKDNRACDVNDDEKVDFADCDAINDHLNGSSAALTPSVQDLPERRMRLLTNYPNPFNPETWIPYQLAQSADVSISIHAADGMKVRTLDIGPRAAGLYLQRNHAAYWDGKNEFGEEVASGLYFYTLSAGDFSTTRSMVIMR